MHDNNFSFPAKPLHINLCWGFSYCGTYLLIENSFSFCNSIIYFCAGVIEDALIFSKPLKKVILKMKKSNLVFPNKNATYTIMREEAHPSESYQNYMPICQCF